MVSFEWGSIIVNLRQLRFITEVARHGLNVSAAAENMYTSQPGVSKQIRQLEDELGTQIFERRGKQLTRITPAGRTIIEYANRALIEIEAIKEAARENSSPGKGKLSIATSNTQARYVLPKVIEKFSRAYPLVDIQLHQGTPNQIAAMVASGEVDFAIATESLDQFDDFVMLPCYHWKRAVIVPKNHALAATQNLSLQQLAEHPLVTYVFGFNERSQLEKAFLSKGLMPRVAFTATDADVIKTYVRQGAGVGIIAKLAYDEKLDNDMVLLDAQQLFDMSTASIGFRRGTFLRTYMYDFVQMFAGHLNRDLVDMAVGMRSKGALRSLFIDMQLPSY